MNLYKIKELCKQREGGLKRLAKEIKMSEANLHRNIEDCSMRAEKLEAIAIQLKVPICTFFNDGDDCPKNKAANNIVWKSNIDGIANQMKPGNMAVNGSITNSAEDTSKIEMLEKEIEHLNRELDSAQIIIKEKERTINILNRLLPDKE